MTSQPVRGGSSRIHWVNVLLLALLLGGSMVAWPTLPDQVPGHFGPDGAVTRWDDRSPLSWLGIPIFAALMTAFMYGLARLLPGRPGLINIPDQDRFRALPPHRQAPVIERATEMLYGVSSLMLVVFGVVQWTRYRTALGADPEPYIALILVVALLTTPVIFVLWVPPIQREVERQVREEKEQEHVRGTG